MSSRVCCRICPFHIPACQRLLTSRGEPYLPCPGPKLAYVPRVRNFYRTTLHYRGIYGVVVCPSLCHKPALYRNGWADRAEFLARMLPSTMQWYTLRFKGNLDNECTFFWNFIPNSKISPQQVHRVVNKTRRSSTLTTLR